MNPKHDLIRALARRLPAIRDRGRLFHDDRAAAAVFLDVAHRGRCPACHRRRARVVSARYAEARCCGVVSLTARTPLRHTHIAMRHWIAAVYQIFHDGEAMSARAFGARHGLRHGTGWKLLHDVRRALPHATPRRRGARGQILGRSSPRNTAHVELSLDEGALVAALVDDGTPPGPRPEPMLARFIGRLRAVITAVHHGVTRRYLRLYLAELAARFKRAHLGVSRGAVS